MENLFSEYKNYKNIIEDSKQKYLAAQVAQNKISGMILEDIINNEIYDLDIFAVSGGNVNVRLSPNEIHYENKYTLVKTTFHCDKYSIDIDDITNVLICLELSDEANKISYALIDRIAKKIAKLLGSDKNIGSDDIINNLASTLSNNVLKLLSSLFDEKEVLLSIAKEINQTIDKYNLSNNNVIDVYRHMIRLRELEIIK